MFLCFGRPKRSTSNKKKSKRKSSRSSTRKSSRSSTRKSVSKQSAPRKSSISIKSTSKNVRKSTSPPRKKDKIPPPIRDAVWIKYHGTASIGICYCCGCNIQKYDKGWHCSHVLADVKGGQEIVDNLRTCCPHCNLSMGDQNLYVYMKEHQMQGPGKRHVAAYLKKHPSQHLDTRTNTWITK